MGAESSGMAAHSATIQDRSPASPRGSRYRARLLAIAGLITFALLPTGETPRPVGAQGLALRFVGTVTLGGKLAPSGTKITVYQGRAIRDVVECATGSVAGSGQYTVEVPLRQGCAVSRNVSCCNFTFVAHDIPGQGNVRMTVGGCNCTTNPLDRPAPPYPDQPFGLSGTKLPGQPDNGPNPIVPVQWYYGQLTLAGAPAPLGTAIRIRQGRAESLTDCGSGKVTAALGQYALAVDVKEGCAASESVSCCHYVFDVDGETVGAGSSSPDLRRLISLGGQTRFQLSGRGPRSPSRTRHRRTHRTLAGCWGMGSRAGSACSSSTAPAG
jgi:hypothetical protein